MSMGRKIWIVSEYYYPIVTSTGYYMTEIAEYLAAKGLNVHVICTGAKYNETSDYHLPENEIHKNVVIHRVLTGNIDKNHFWKRALRLLSSSILLFLKVLKSVNRGDELLVVTNPAFLLLFIPIIKSIKGVSYKLLVHDVFPENLMAIGRMKSDSLSYRCLKTIYDRAYSKADICISIGRDMTNVIKKKTNKNAGLVLIPNWADNKDVYPMDKTETTLYSQLKKPYPFIFQFAGNLGHAQGLDNILNAISLVDNPNLHFLFIGGGAKYEAIRTFSKNRDNVSLVGFQERSNQNDFLNACDVAIVTLNDGMYGLGVPSKSYNIMAAGKPILMIGEQQSEIALCVKEFDLGWVVEPNDPVALKETFESIYNQQGNLSSIKNNARCIADTVFAKDTILDRYYQLFQKKINL